MHKNEKNEGVNAYLAGKRVEGGRGGKEEGGRRRKERPRRAGRQLGEKGGGDWGRGEEENERKGVAGRVFTFPAHNSSAMEHNVPKQVCNNSIRPAIANRIERINFRMLIYNQLKCQTDPRRLKPLK